MGEIKRLIHEVHRRSLARAHEELGEVDRAIEYYRAYVEQLSNGAGLPRVDRARERLSALSSGD